MKHSGIDPRHIMNPALRAQIVAQLPGVPRLAGSGAKTAGPRLRQDTKGPNKTEAAFAAYLRTIYTESEIKEQGVTLRLANGIRYTPDVFVKFKLGDVALFEVKGFMRDDAAAKIKFAATAFKFWKFYLVTARDRSMRAWDIQEILP